MFKKSENLSIFAFTCKFSLKCISTITWQTHEYMIRNSLSCLSLLLYLRPAFYDIGIQAAFRSTFWAYFSHSDSCWSPEEAYRILMSRCRFKRLLIYNHQQVTSHFVPKTNYMRKRSKSTHSAQAEQIPASHLVLCFATRDEIEYSWVQLHAGIIRINWVCLILSSN